MLKAQAILTGFSTKLDGSASVRFSTQELLDEDFLVLKQHQGKFGWLLFKEGEEAPEEIPDWKFDSRKKSPSKRLRNVLFVLWKQQKLDKDFETYYNGIMEKLIDHYKEKLNDNE